MNSLLKEDVPLMEDIGFIARMLFALIFLTAAFGKDP